MTAALSAPRRSLEIAALRRAYRAGALTVAALVEDLIERMAQGNDPALWITPVGAAALRARARALDAQDAEARARLPLFGIPFAVKDNIDAAGLPTTAGCAAFAAAPGESAAAVALLLEAGAILLGKTNLDQFATGLVGTRSPYGVPRNPFAAEFSPGGSSSGSAVAVAAGLASFALGTDTAGSGRVPAAFNNLVGLKPTRGLISARGVVPACRSLDCVSIFALTTADALAVFDVAARFDAGDPLARRAEPDAAPLPAAGFRFGVPAPAELEFFGDAEQARRYAEALAALESLGGERVAVPLAPFRAAAQLLYDGPWVAERLHAVEDLLARDPGAFLPVTRAIIETGRRYHALDVFRASYALAALKRETEPVWQAIDALVLPTTGTIYRLAEIAAEPVRLNQNLGYYTNFVNLLDLAALAVPAGFRTDGLPFGVTLIGPAFSDRRLAALAARLQRHFNLPLGATGAAAVPEEPAPAIPPVPGRIALAVVGAHMSGMALNHELAACGARFAARVQTAARYRLFALPGTPARPGLVRVEDGAAGAAIEAEIWTLEPAGFGTFVAAVPSPLAIGTLHLADGATVKGFLCEAAATTGARDISTSGGWRRFVAGD